MTIFIFYKAPKRSRVLLFHQIQLLINFEKGIRRQLHFLSLQVHLFIKTRNVFCLKLIKVKLFNFSVWHFYFLRKNIWQTCLFLPNSIKICRKQKDFSARFSDKSETVFLGTFSLLALKMSAVPPNCSLYEILQSPCGSSREEVEHVLLSECNADISAHLASCHLSKCSEVTEAKLIMARAGIQHLSRIQLEGMTICPRHRHLLGRFWRGPRSCQYPGHTGKVTSVTGSHVITFQIADEIRLIFKEIAAVGSRKYQ